jgi:UTP--glucose-1-phosphate uridylyltransferase
MVEAYAEIGGGNMVATMEVPHANVSSYGILDVDASIGATMPVRGMVEKPKPDVAPSNMAVIGRYILSPNVLRNLDDAEVGAGGEIQLTDAIAREIAARGDVYGFRFKGRRFDCGSKPGYLQATVAFGLSRPDLREEFLDFLRTVTESEFRRPAKVAARA